MRKTLAFLILSVFLLGIAACGDPHPGDNGGTDDPVQEVTMRLSVDAGWVIHKPTPTNINGVYRYGPCLISDGEGNIDMYTASPGDSFSEWDWGRYRHSTDGGKTWGQETVAVKPTPGQMDAVSTCDPGVFKVGEYYYAGYTSTYDPRGVSNAIFIGRSKTAEGPFNEKWTGSGWSLYESEPAMTYDGDPSKFGIGEPSFVVKDGKIYMYYNWWDADADGAEISQTRVALADAASENWPATLTEKGVAFDKKYSDEDSSDVKYVEEYDLFIAVNTAKRFTEDSFIAVYESKDGLTFQSSTVIRKNIAKFCHNMGLSGDVQGHIKKGEPLYLAYGYSTDGISWANWYTRMHKVTLTAVEPGTADPEVSASNSQKPESDKTTHGGTQLETIHSREPVVYLNSKDSTRQITLFSVNNELIEREITGSSRLTYRVQDEQIAAVNASGVIQPKKAGSTYVKALYDNDERFYALIRVNVFDSSLGSAVASAGFAGKELVCDGGTFATASVVGTASERWIGVEGATASEVKGIAIFPKYQGLNFPKNFTVQYRNASGAWTDVPGQVYKNYSLVSATSVTPVVLKFDAPVQTDAVRMVDNDKAGAKAQFELGELIPLAGSMADTVLKPQKSAYELSFDYKPRAQLKLEADWAFGFKQEYFRASSHVAYSGYDEEILSVTADGMMTAKKSGSTTVTMAFYGQTIQVTVTVK